MSHRDDDKANDVGDGQVEDGQMAQAEFRVVRRGYERAAVDAALEDLRDQIAQAEATTLAARTYSTEILTELRRLQALEDELTGSLELAHRTADAVRGDAEQEAARLLADARERSEALLAASDTEAGAKLAVAELEAASRLATADESAQRCVSDAEAEARRLLAEGRARLAAEAAELDRYRLAIAAEAVMLNQIESRLGPKLSRAAARLVEVVDAPDGLGPFSQATASLVHVARLMQRSALDGTLGAVEVEIDGGDAVLRVRTEAIDLRDGPLMVPIGRLAPPPTIGEGARGDQDENALNISSMALS